MFFNKNQFRKIDDKKVLRKRHKQWIILSVAALSFVGTTYALDAGGDCKG